ncbi:MAG: zinc ribbon domain-containing protein [Pseudomonadota bacterium]
MPVYEYECQDCGAFEAPGSLATFDAPSSCPTCGAPSPRVLLTAPSISVMNNHRRRAIATNERSSDSPKRASHHGLTPTGPKIGSRKAQAANGSKNLPGVRPWMLSR